MNETTISESLENRKRGGFLTIIVDRPANTRKGVTDDIRKVSTMQGQLCDYSAKKVVREAVEDGTRDEPVLPSHIQETFYVGQIRFWRGNNGQVYLPVPLVGNKPKVTWVRNGNNVDRAEIADLLLASELRGHKPADEDKGQVAFVGIKVENIAAIH